MNTTRLVFFFLLSLLSLFARVLIVRAVAGRALLIDAAVLALPERHHFPE